MKCLVGFNRRIFSVQRRSIEVDRLIGGFVEPLSLVVVSTHNSQGPISLQCPSPVLASMERRLVRRFLRFSRLLLNSVIPLMIRLAPVRQQGCC